MRGSDQKQIPLYGRNFIGDTNSFSLTSLPTHIRPWISTTDTNGVVPTPPHRLRVSAGHDSHASDFQIGAALNLLGPCFTLYLGEGWKHAHPGGLLM